MTDDAWEVRPLRSTLLRRPRYGINAPASPSGAGGKPYIRITDIDDDGRFRPAPRVEVLHPNSASYLLQQGDVVFARTGASVGKSYRYDPADGALVFAGFLINITPNPEILDPGYLAIYVHTAAYWNWVAATSVRSGQPGINGREYALMPLPMPPIEVQRAISAVIADAESDIDVVERLITKKQAIKEGIAQQLLTGRIRLPQFSEPWTWQPFGEVMARINAKKTQILASSYRDAGLLPVVDQGKRPVIGYTDNLDAGFDPGLGGVIVFGDHTCITKFIDFKFAVGADGTQLVTAKSPHSTRFFACAFEVDPVVSTGYNRHFKFLREKVLPVPPRDEQDAIVAVLADAEAEIELLKKRLGKAKAIKQGIVQQLLTGKTRRPVLETVA